MKFKGIYIWFSIPVVLIVIWFLVVYIPFNAGMKKKETKLTVAKNERQVLERSMRDLVNETSAQKKLHESYDYFMSEMPVIEGLPDYMKALMNAAKNKGVLINRVNAHYDTIDINQKRSLMNPVFDLSLTGGFLEIGQFLEEMSRKSSFRKVQFARLNYTDREYPQLSGKFVVELKALKGNLNESK